jgi:quercetin dioxygenase-like cupin family protein
MEEMKNQVSPFPVGGINPVSQYFTGKTYLARLTPEDAQTDISNVTFEPGCINHWHVHHGCQQIIVCVGGEGWYQEWGKEAVRMKPGDVISIPLDTKHWHGAAKNSWFAHLSVMSRIAEGSHEWLEPVDPAEYDKLPE